MKPFLLAVVLSFLACKNTSSESGERTDGYTAVLKTKEDSLYHEVMQGHDVAMAKMGRLRKHLKQIQHELDSLTKLPSKKIDQRYQQALIELQEDLNYADHSMYTWMDEFKADSAKDDKSKRLPYLEAEKVKVEKVKKSIFNSMQRADSLLKN
jgi:paraquat-inducible protein B